jgi:hypothetical protein
VADYDNIDEGIKAIISGLVTLGGVILAVSVLPGLTVAGLLTTNFQFTLLLVGFFMFLTYFTQQTGQLSFTFALASIALLLLINHFLLPSWISDLFQWEQWLGISLPAFDAVDFTVLAFVVITLYWIVMTRLTGKAKKPETIADRVGKNYVNLFETYGSLARIVAITLAGVWFVLLAQAAGLLGQFGDILAQAPFVSSNLFVGIVGFDALGGTIPIIGELPIVGDIGPTGWFVLVIVVLGLAAASEYDTSGPLSRVFNR